MSGRKLETWALLPPEQAAEHPELDKLAPVASRIYTHPALEEPVIRLVAEATVEGEDAMLAYYGFEPAESGPAVAFEVRRTLGFPGWALVCRPELAHHALAVVAKLEKEMHRAKSKLWHVWKALPDLAKTLEADAPELLPTFWEEVGRRLLHLGNTSHAAQSFSKAREAERVHELETDLERLQAVFVEFTLAGAVTAKDLVAYGRELAERLPAEDAWTLYWDLCSASVEAGRPPWKSMVADLKQMLESGHPKPKETFKEVIAALLEAPNIERAAQAFWIEQKDTIGEILAEDAATAGRIRDLMPAPPNAERFPAQWLQLVHRWGIVQETFVHRDGKVERAPSTPAAYREWIERFLGRLDGWIPGEIFQSLADILERQVAFLRQDEIGLNLSVGPRNEISVVLLDRVLGLGLKVVDPPDPCTLDFDAWQEEAEAASDLQHISEDPRYRPLLARDLARQCGQYEPSIANMVKERPLLEAVLIPEEAEPTGTKAEAFLSRKDETPWLESALELLHGYRPNLAIPVTRHWHQWGSFLAGGPKPGRPPVMPIRCLDLLSSGPENVWPALWRLRSPTELEHLIRFLEWWRDSPFPRLEGRQRLYTGSFDPVPDGDWEARTHFFFEQQASRFIVHAEGVPGFLRCLVFECSADGVARAPENFEIFEELDVLLNGDVGWWTVLIEGLTEHGIPNPPTRVIQGLGQDLGIPVAEAACLLMLLLPIHLDVFKPIFPPEVASELSITKSDLKAADQSLRALPPERWKAVAAAVLEDPEAFFRGYDGVADRVATAYRGP